MRVVSATVGAIVERQHFDDAAIPAIVVSSAGRIVRANRSMRGMVEGLPGEAGTVGQLFGPTEAGAILEFVLGFTPHSAPMEGPTVTLVGRRVCVLGAPTGLGDGSSGVCLQLLDRQDQANREDRLQRLAFEDAQTGLLNRRGFDVAADQLLKAARRDDRSVAFMFIDVDSLKATNDEFGHAAGDRVIEAVGKLLSDVCRDADAVGRYGGDEFCVLALISGGASADALRHRLIEAASSRYVSHDGRRLPVRVTVGLVCTPARQVRNLPDLVDSGDQAMYSERRDRDQVDRP